MSKRKNKLKSDRLPPNPAAKRIVHPVRFNHEEMRHVLSLAVKFTGGKIGPWIRKAAINYRPKKGDFEK